VNSVSQRPLNHAVRRGYFDEVYSNMSKGLPHQSTAIRRRTSSVGAWRSWCGGDNEVTEIADAAPIGVHFLPTCRFICVKIKMSVSYSAASRTLPLWASD
jgi:hypothetical protein